MLCRWCVVVWMVLLSLQVRAQNETSFTIPDYNEIEKLTTDKNSLFYYGNLYSRYSVNDTELTLRDYLLLYYGHFFQPGYLPFYNTPEADSMKILIHSKDDLTKEDWQAIIRMGKAHLQKNPFDLKGINIVWVAHQRAGDSATARGYFDKLRKLVQTILSTGDGLSEKTAFHVLNISHEYDVIHILGYQFGGHQKLTVDKCDYLSLKPNQDNVTGLFFDVKQIFRGYEKALSTKAP